MQPRSPPLRMHACVRRRYFWRLLQQWNEHEGVAVGCDGVSGDAYEPGQAVGVGIKAEMWKTKHPNLTILETGEDTPVLVSPPTGCIHYFILFSERKSDIFICWKKKKSPRIVQENYVVACKGHVCPCRVLFFFSRKSSKNRCYFFNLYRFLWLRYR